NLPPLDLERGADRPGPGERTAAQQRLVLPDPRLVALVAAEVIEARDHEAGAPARPQPRIDLVQAPGARLDRQEVDQALDQAREEPRVVERGGPRRLLVAAGRVVQEHEVEVRAVAELEAAELAVADHGEAGF